MKLTVIGCMGGYPSKTQATTSYLLEAEGFKLLIDAGSGSFSHLSQVMEPTDLDAMILTHYHADHIADVGVFQYAYQLKPTFEGLKKKTLTIYGHSQGNQFESLTMPGVSMGVAYQPNETLRLGPFKIQFLKTIHPVPTYALRIEEKNSKKVLVFTADSAYLADFITFAQGADLFLADAMLLSGNEDSQVHMTSAQVAKLGQLAQVKEVVLTHLPASHWEDLLQQAQEVAPEMAISLAEDFKVYEI